MKKELTEGKGCGIITKLSREGSTEKAKQGFGPGGLKKVLKKVLTNKIKFVKLKKLKQAKQLKKVKRVKQMNFEN